MTENNHPTPSVKGRYAPSPTGRMHLGNVMCALVSYLSAKSKGGTWLLRIEDLDPGRSRYEYARRIEEDLSILGLDWDEGGLDGKQLPGTGGAGLGVDGSRVAGSGVAGLGSYCQSRRTEIYAGELARIAHLTYPCYCSRADILAAQAPHESDGGIVYPGTCRPARLASAAACLPESASLYAGMYSNSDDARRFDRGEDIANPTNDSGRPHSTRIVVPDRDSNSDDERRFGRDEGIANPTNDSGRPHSTRIVVPDRDICFMDGNYGEQRINLTRECGDFIVRRSDGVFAYQLAVVVDDALMGVTEVVRGRDLLRSTALQLYLYEVLGYSAPSFCHIPLLCASDGRRLCKRDASLDMGELLRTQTPSQIIGHLAHLLGLLPTPDPCLPRDLIPLFSPTSLPTTDIIL